MLYLSRIEANDRVVNIEVVRLEYIILDKLVYEGIRKYITSHKAERGGIIGYKDSHISNFYYDGLATCTFNEYIPNTAVLNGVIDDWDQNGIEFIGFVHSHTPHRKSLSPSDKEYAVKVLEVFDYLPYLIIGVVGENDSFPLTLFSIHRDGSCEEMEYLVE